MRSTLAARVQEHDHAQMGDDGKAAGPDGVESQEDGTVSEHTPFIDFENLPTPSEGFLVTHFITVRSVARSRAFYSNVLGGQVVLEENPCIIKLANSWVIMNPGGRPTPDKPGIWVVPYEPSNEVSSFLNLRVADIDACYRDWK